MGGPAPDAAPPRPLPHSLRNFFRRAADMIYFKRLIQIPRLPEVLPSPVPHDNPMARSLPQWAAHNSYLLSPQSPPNFLRASALAEHIKPVVVVPEEVPEDEEPENLIEISSGPPAQETPVRTLGVGGGSWDHPSGWVPAYLALGQVVADLFEQTFGPSNGSVKDDR